MGAFRTGNHDRGGVSPPGGLPVPAREWTVPLSLAAGFLIRGFRGPAAPGARPLPLRRPPFYGTFFTRFWVGG